jgi:hypothetical protein
MRNLALRPPAAATALLQPTVTVERRCPDVQIGDEIPDGYYQLCVFAGELAIELVYFDIQ